jgi:hypothetical protein
MTFVAVFFAAAGVVFFGIALTFVAGFNGAAAFVSFLPSSLLN